MPRLCLSLQLGNPVLEYATDLNSRAEFFWSHGLISDSTYKLFTTGCNYSRYVSEYYRDSISPLCSKVLRQVARETSKFVDKYDVTLDVCISSVLSQSKAICPQGQVSLFFFLIFLSLWMFLISLFSYDTSGYSDFQIVLFHYILKNFTPLAKQKTNESIDVCVDDKVTNYLNRKDVQEALHAKLVGVQKWDVCNK